MLRTNMESPLVSIIIPCRNEAKFFGKCLESVLANDFLKDKLEILIIDGMSEDKTREIINQYAETYTCIRVLENPKKVVPTALNIGIKNAVGQIIIRMDAHNIYSKDYISKCVQYLKKYNVDNVGGIWVTLPGADTVVAQSIALALSHPFGVGNAHYRVGLKEPKLVDTVPFGCYRKDVFERIGLFDEDLVRNQDDEFNMRLIKNGGKILLVPEIISYYYARDTLSKLSRMLFQYGYFKPLVVKKVGSVLTWRQLIPSLFITSLIISGILSLMAKYFLVVFLLILLSYLFTNILFSLLITLNKGVKYLFFLPVVFTTMHCSYGIGYLKGVIDFILLRKHRSDAKHDIKITR
jgi:glycosyltransferase involved in cell wall biosynthesis